LKYQIAPKVPDSSQKITVRLILNACLIFKMKMKYYQMKKMI